MTIFRRYFDYDKYVFEFDSGFPCKPSECSLCGNPAQATWHGKNSIDICYCCATTHLPMLIADAVVGFYFSGECIPARKHNGLEAINKITSKFWYAYSGALEKAMQRYRKIAEAESGANPANGEA